MSLPTHMNVAMIENYGGPEVLQLKTVALPNIAAGEILVRVHSAGVSPFDIHMRDGWYQQPQYAVPIILGWELSGAVAAIGKEVNHFKVGGDVFAYPSGHRKGGSYAEFNTIKENEAVHKPGSINHHQAAAASMNALTAWQALFDIAQLSAGQTVLIHAAAGGIGHLAVQLAKWKGAHVIGTASAKNAEFLAELGVDEFIDYTTTAFEKAVKPVDVVLDLIGGDTLLRSFQAVKKSGIVVTAIDFENIKKAANFGVRGAAVFVDPNTQQLSAIADLLEKGVLKPHVSTVFPLADVAKAHELVQWGRVRGKVALEI